MNVSLNMTEKLSKNKYYAALASLLLGAVYVPLAIGGGIPIDRVSSLIAIISFALLLVGASKISDILPFAILYFLIYAVTASHLIGSVVILIIAEIGLGANEIILSSSNPRRLASVYAFLPISVMAAYFLTGSTVAIVAVVIPFAFMTALGFCVIAKKNRKDVILILTVVAMGIVAALAIGYMLFTKTSPEQLKSAYVGERDAIINYLCSYSVDMGGEIIPLFMDTSYAADIMISTLNLLPSIVVISFIAVSFFLYGYQVSVLRKLGKLEYVTEEILDIDISGTAAAVYLIAFVLSITTDSYGNLPFGSVVCQNLYTILTPALAYAGVKSVKSFIQKKRIRIGFLLMIPIVLLAMTGYMFMILSLVGIICIFARNAKAWAEKKD